MRAKQIGIMLTYAMGFVLLGGAFVTYLALAVVYLILWLPCTPVVHIISKSKTGPNP